jgi:hypothetical protein
VQVRRDGAVGGSSHMIERISRRPAPSLKSAAAVTGRCRLKVEKNARNASSSLACDSAMSMSNDGLKFTGAYIIRLVVALLLHHLI